MKNIGRNIIIIISILLIFNGILFIPGIKNEIANITNVFLNVDKKKDNQEIQKLEEKNQKLINENTILSEENNDYKEELKIKKENNSKLEVGKLLYRKLNDLENLIVINIGRDKGVKQNQLVLNKGKVVGTIISVRENDSDVKLFNSGDSILNISIKIVHQNKAIDGVIEKYSKEEKKLNIKTLYQNVKLQKGDKIFTNGYKENQPKNAYIGKINKVTGTGVNTKYLVNISYENYDTLEVLINE